MNDQLAELYEEQACLVSLVQARGWKYLQDMLVEQGDTLVKNAMPCTTTEEYTFLGYRTEVRAILRDIPARISNRLESIQDIIAQIKGEHDD